MLKQILDVHRDICIIISGYIEDFKRILKDYRYIQRMRKGDIEK